MANPASTLDVTSFIDRNRVTPFQVLIAVLCFLIVAIDGFDTAAIGFIAPSIRALWHLSPQQLGPVFGAGLAGLMAGALLFGPIGDRIGRKRLLLGCLLVFGVSSVAAAAAPSFGWLIALRFATGLGLGGAMPNAVTLTSEYCPARLRSFLVTTMFCGFTCGSALGGFAAAMLIVQYGWRSVLLVGGIVPLAMALVYVRALPESVRYMVNAQWPPARIAAALRRIDPNANLDGVAFSVADVSRGSSGSRIGRLFTPELRNGTLLLWLTFFMSLLLIYLLQSWLPMLLHTSGASLRTAALVTAMFQVGGTLGAIALGWLMDRLNPCFVLAVAYVLAGVFTAAIGHLTGSPWLAAISVFLAGVCVSGTQCGANALSAAFYPSDCRVTGVSYANGVGRFGSVLGSLAGGSMLAAGLDMPMLFSIVGMPAIVAGCAMTVFGFHLRRDEVALSPVAGVGH
ncbi:MFS transporter [Paraburkholderia lycopersici]|uniref:MFS transporter, AAHS family, 4-hydroxybenzoate transporter n=1 Tax=Paraburkholderia lycopersici TaxID=416944 RepID=A0A1G6R0D3_9BURK|nr:MFS transporter [Paraburkholderia lycopersici]SDC97515.1 MFS transporter, AAHS family, 4-hydroxybenzoate transporter [Paraburkholderia lycopersici]